LIQELKVKLFYLRWIAIICLRGVPDFKTDGHPLFVYEVHYLLAKKDNEVL
jgi:hypothetical protein